MYGITVFCLCRKANRWFRRCNGKGSDFFLYHIVLVSSYFKPHLIAARLHRNNIFPILPIENFRLYLRIYRLSVVLSDYIYRGNKAALFQPCVCSCLLDGIILHLYGNWIYRHGFVCLGRKCPVVFIGCSCIRNCNCIFSHMKSVCL